MDHDSRTVLPEEKDLANPVHGPSEPARIEDFDHDWYIRVKLQVKDVQRVDRASEMIIMETEVVSLFEGTRIPKGYLPDITITESGLQAALPEHDIKLWPTRLVDRADNSNNQTYTCYWVLGLPTISSSDLAVSKQHLREWQGHASTQITQTNHVVQTKFIPKKVFVQQTLLPAEDEDLPKEARRPGNTFKKIPGSNPHQIRRQFLKHVMGSDGPEGQMNEPSVKLRPAKDVLKKLKYDPAFDVNDYVIGYIDRKEGILEMPVTAWESFQQEDIVAYFRQVSEDRIIWDRAKKIDRLTAAL